MATCAEITGERLPENAGEGSVSVSEIAARLEGLLAKQRAATRTRPLN